MKKINVTDNSAEQKVDVRTREEKIRDSHLKRDPDHFKKIGSKGGKKGGRPFRDPEVARRAVNKRWEKYRANNSRSKKTSES